jgi:predicted CXXCH cytochrome family protein
MFAAGVTCSDCHDPHNANLRLPGDGVCVQCHSTEKYTALVHHRHEAVNPPLGCASCHMPTRTYMVVDRRHDHSFRIPRPDLSVKLGTPNACNDCHTDKTPEWAASAIETWHGPNREGFQTYAEAFREAWSGRADAAALLGAVAANANVPAFARASALTELASFVSPSNIKLAQTGLSDADPMVRIGALNMLENLPASQIWPLVSPLLSDSNRGVRIRAVGLLAAVPTASQPLADRGPFDRAAAEFIAAQRLNADRPEARSALGTFYAQRGLQAEAEMEYRAALRLSPQYAPAAANLADFYRALGREVDGENVLRVALAASPRDAGLHHALGLTLVRLKRNDEPLAELRRAAELDPDVARYAYVYAVALHSAGRVGDAMIALKESLSRHPDDRDTLLALIAFSRDAGDLATALEYAERLAGIVPSDVSLTALIDNLRNQIKKPEAMVQNTAVPQEKSAGTAHQGKPDFSILQGRWVRPDGGYTIIIKGVDAEGNLDATYFNPSSLPFSKAQATVEANTLNVFLELRAGGYSGSTYTLKYDAGDDRLAGVYFQAVAQEKFNIYFVRAK